MFLIHWLPWRTVPFVFFPLPALGTASVFWQTDRAQFRADWRRVFMAIAAGLIWAGGAGGSGWCYSAHVCMAGHMDHPLCALWHYAADAGWSLAVALAAFWMLSLRVSLCLAFGVLSSFLISDRFLFGSLGGRNVVIPLRRAAPCAASRCFSLGISVALVVIDSHGPGRRAKLKGATVPLGITPAIWCRVVRHLYGRLASEPFP
jgi:hypothetical protein